jgi:hypothetical protein
MIPDEQTILWPTGKQLYRQSKHRLRRLPPAYLGTENSYITQVKETKSA